MPNKIEGAAGVTARETKFGADPVPDRLATWGLLLALSVTVSVPILLPNAEGLNATLMLHVLPAGTLVPQVFVSAKSPAAAMLVIASVVLKLLVNVIIWAVLIVPAGWLLKLRLLGESVAVGLPVPSKDTVCGLPAALSMKVIAPVRDPVAVGVNVTLIVQLPPTTTVLPQVFVCPKSPLAAILEMMSAAVPVLFSVSVWAALVVPTGVPPSAATNVAMTDVRASDAEEVAVAVCVPVAEMILSSEKASVPDPLFGDDSVFPYPVPIVHVPDPLSRAKRVNTNSFAVVVGPEVETVPAMALD